MAFELDLLFWLWLLGIPDPYRFVCRACGYLGTCEVPGYGFVPVVISSATGG